MSGRYSVKAITFNVGDEQFSFPPYALGYLPPPDEAGAEPGTALHEVLSVVEDANEDGRTLHLAAEHAEAIADYTRHFAGVYPEQCELDREMLAALSSSSSN